MSLRNWLENGWLTERTISRQEIAKILSAAERDLRECSIEELSADWKLNIAYTATMRVAVAALAVSGYRASREQYHFRVIQSLVYSIGAESSLIKEIDQLRKKRNVNIYDQAETVSEYEADRMVELALTIRDRVVMWLHEEYPEFID